MSFPIHEIIFFVSFNTVALTILMISLYGIYKLYQYRHETFVIKRDYNVVILTVVISMVYYVGECILGNMFIICKELFLRNGIGTSLIVIMLQSVGVAGIIINWMRYYTNNWSIEISNKKWQHIITGNQTSNWFIDNKHKYGSFRYVFKMVCLLQGIIAVICCILCYFVAVLGFSNDKKDNNIAAILCIPILVLLGIPNVILAVIIKKTPVFDDIFYIGKENDLRNKVAGGCFIISLGIAFHLCMPIWTDISFLAVAVGCNIWARFSCGYIAGINLIISTVFVVNDNCKNMTHKNENNIPPNNISHVLLNSHKTEAFIEHLIKELSIENILAYIEFNQFINYIHKEHNVTLDGYKRGTFMCLFSQTYLHISIYIRNIL